MKNASKCVTSGVVFSKSVPRRRPLLRPRRPLGLVGARRVAAGWGGVAAAVAEDRHYCLLVPLTVEVFIVWTICHWMFSKIHRHAYC